jgi:hypothetical protein
MDVRMGYLRNGLEFPGTLQLTVEPGGRGDGMSYEEALRMASRDERFMATVYAMNSLLIYKGVYTHQEFQRVFTEWVEKEQEKNAQTQDATSQVSHASHA